MEGDDMGNLAEKIKARVTWAGRKSKKGTTRKVPLNFDGLLNATLSGAIPNLAPKFQNAENINAAVEVISNYLLSTKDISSSHFPTLLGRKEAPNYQFRDYTLDTNEMTKQKVISWLLSFYYLDLVKFDAKGREKERVIVAVRSSSPDINEILQEYLVIGSEFQFKLSTGRIETTFLDKPVSFYLPSYPSAAYLNLLLLISIVLNQLRFQNTEGEYLPLAHFEAMILRKRGGNKWSVMYYPTIHLWKLYNMFFRDIELPKQKFVIFLESLMPPTIQNTNIIDAYYSVLSDLAFSMLIEGYLNVNKLSRVISEKISLELRAKRENVSHKLGKIYYADYVQTKFFGGENVEEDFEKLRKQMKAIALRIGELAEKGDTQKSLLKRIIMDVKGEEIPVYFVETLVSYLPRLEREGIHVSLPDKLVSLPIKEFLILKNEFVVTLWNSYIGGKNDRS